MLKKIKQNLDKTDILEGAFLDRGTLSSDLKVENTLDFSTSKPKIKINYFNQTLDKDVYNRVKFKDFVITNKVVFDRALIKKLPHLKALFITATGTNNIDTDCCKQMGIKYYNIPGYASSSVAQLVISYILNFATQLIPYHQDVVEGRWSNSPFFHIPNKRPFEIEGMTLGIIGGGDIGKRVAQMAKSLKLKVLLSERKNATKLRRGRSSFKDCLQKSDFISLHCPLNIETQHLFSANEFKIMKKTAYLINTARGPLIDQVALKKALINEIIAGAALDVLDSEPPNQNHPLIKVPKKLKYNNKLILTPHIGWFSTKAQGALLNTLHSNIVNWINLLV